MKDRLWFKAKRYGWGWYPCTWQGWLVILGYVLCLAAILSRLDNTSVSLHLIVRDFIAPFIILSAILIEICYRKGEKPGWHWGK